MLVKNQRGFLLERILQGIQTEKKPRQFRVLLERREVFRSFRLALPLYPQRLALRGGQNLRRAQIRIIIEQATVPVVVDAGLGAPSHAAEAMEMGADAVLVNTAIAIASDPVRMAKAFKKAIEAGREAREIGLADKLNAASATSPLTGFLKL